MDSRKFHDARGSESKARRRSFRGGQVKTMIQLTFKNVVIHTVPAKRKFYSKSADIPESKTIINDVSGTVLPGQFLAIIGASGKPPFSPHSLQAPARPPSSTTCRAGT